MQSAFRNAHLLFLSLYLFNKCTLQFSIFLSHLLLFIYRCVLPNGKKKTKTQWKHYLSSNLLSKYQQWPLKNPFRSTTSQQRLKPLGRASWRISRLAVLPPWWGISSCCSSGDAASKQKEPWKLFFFLGKTLLQGLLCLEADLRAAKPWSDENRPSTSHFIWLVSRQGSVHRLVRLSQRGAALTAHFQPLRAADAGSSVTLHLLRKHVSHKETRTPPSRPHRPRRCTHRC